MSIIAIMNFNIFYKFVDFWEVPGRVPGGPAGPNMKNKIKILIISLILKV